MIFCVCCRISDREIARHAHARPGFDEIQFELGVATQCGQCGQYGQFEGCAGDLVAQCSGTCSTAHIKRATNPLHGSTWHQPSPLWQLSPEA